MAEPLPSIGDAFVCAPNCVRCLGTGFVCENHMGIPWSGVSPAGGCGCGAPGAPCPGHVPGIIGACAAVVFTGRFLAHGPAFARFYRSDDPLRVGWEVHIPGEGSRFTEAAFALMRPGPPTQLVLYPPVSAGSFAPVTLCQLDGEITTWHDDDGVNLLGFRGWAIANDLGHLIRWGPSVPAPPEEP